MNGGLPLAARLVVVATTAAGIATTGFALHRWHSLGFGPSWLVALFGLFLLTSWLFPIVYYQDGSSQSLHLDEGLLAMFVMILPPDGVVACGVAVAVVADLIQRRPPVKLLFNVSQAALCLSLAVSAKSALWHAGRLDWRGVAAATLAGVVFFLVNSTVISTLMAALTSDGFVGRFLDAFGTRVLLLGASVSIGLVAGAAARAYPFTALMAGLPFLAFRETLAGHFRARHDRTRLRGLFDATLEITRSMRREELAETLRRSVSSLLRAPDVVLEAPGAAHPGDDGSMRAVVPVFGEPLELTVTGRSRSEPFDMADRALLDALGAVGSAALENASLYEDRRRQQENLVAITSSLAEGVCAFDLEGNLTFVNPAAEALLGWSSAELIGPAAIPTTDVKMLVSCALRVIRNGRAFTASRGTTFARRNGEVFPVAFTCSPIHAQEGVAGAVLAFRDISEQVAYEDQLTHHAYHDALTGLPNRRLFLDRLEHALARLSKTHGAHAVFLIDVDRFKITNDSLGHQVGDELLIALAARLRAVAGEEPTLARFGGDEFTLLVEEVGGAAEVAALGQRMLQAVEAPFVTSAGRPVIVSISVGAALGGAGAHPDDVLHDADVAMLQAKRRGAGQLALYDAAVMRARSDHEIDLEVDLRGALERHELVVYYQPLIDTVSRAVIGAEALVRWQHPTRGLLGPGDFIELAETTGLVVPLGRAVLEEATRQTRAWLSEHSGPFRISVNLSARQFQDEDLIPMVLSTLERTGLPPQSLCLEITESLAHYDLERSIELLSEMRAAGIKVAIDDFGTGFSSLNYLKRLPADVIKLDYSFVHDLTTSPMDQEIVSSVVRIASSAGMTALAEGVETAEQLDILQRLECPVLQGFLLGRPVPAEEFAERFFARPEAALAAR